MATNIAKKLEKRCVVNCLAQIVKQANQDADSVIAFLNDLGLKSLPGATASVQAAFLLELAAGLRLFAWEHAELHMDQRFGLPKAEDAVREVIRAVLDDPDKLIGNPLGNWVFKVSLIANVYHDGALISGDVRIDMPDDDDFAKAVAQFLWKHRHDVRTLEETPIC